ncbi:hypothetical protein H0H87_011821 [Tephrocybe sp. NHM501043]|nr:hypothetical protein H0H87_011821 [Tephrocybe sp. NHM501043]
MRSYHETPRYRTSYEAETTPTASSFIDVDTNSFMKQKPSFAVTAKWASGSRPSSESDSSSVRSWIDIKERKSPPPPLFLQRSNLRRTQTEETPVIEIIAPGPPRVESRLSSYTLDVESPQPITPDSPDFLVPSEEEIRRRRHEKVMRTLGERIPPELVYRGPKIPNVTVFPDPPSPNDSETTPREYSKNKLSRRGSFTLSSFPNLSSVASTLTSHARTKSRDALHSLESPSTETPTPLSFSRHNRPSDIATPTLAAYRSSTHPRSERPATVYSPIVFANRPTSQAFFVPENEDKTTLSSTAMTHKEAERAAKLARRASLSTATFLPTSPMRDGFRDLTPSSPRSPLRRSYNPESSSPLRDTYRTADSRARPESTILSPLVFSKHTSLVGSDLNFSFTVSDDDTDETVTEEKDEEEDDLETQSSHIPLRHKLYVQPESGHGRSADEEHYSRSNPHLPLHIRPDTPFQNSGVPLEAKSGFLAPPGWTPKAQGRDLIQRKERRQGWSGEWNQGDMQDVIKKLRSLK